MMMNNLVAAIEYDGTKFQGSQKQPNVRTVQGVFDDFVMEKSIQNNTGGIFKERYFS